MDAPEVNPQEFPSLEDALRKRRLSERISLSEEEGVGLLTRVRDDFVSGAGQTAQFKANRLKYVNNWRQRPTPIEKGPVGERSANIRVPLTTIAVEQWKARLGEALAGEESIARFVSLDDSNKKITEDLDEWFNWELENVVDLRKVLDSIFHNLLVDGVCLAIPEYVKSREDTVRIEEFEIADGMDVRDAMHEVIQNLFTVQEVEETGPGEYKVKATEGDAKVRFGLDGWTLKAEIKQEEILFDGVKVRIPSIEDVVVPNVGSELGELPFFGIRVWMRVWEVAKMRESIFSTLSDKEMKKVEDASTPQKDGSYLSRYISRQYEQMDGALSSGTGATPPEYERWVEVFRWEGRIKVGSKEVGATVWVDPRASVILGIKRESRRSAEKFEFVPCPGQFYSLGIGELLQHTQTELDGIHNFRLNSGLIATAPGGFYEPMAMKGGQTIQWEPGKWIPARNVDKIKPIQVGWNSVWGFNEERLVQENGRELTALGDMGTGTFVSKRVSASEFVGTQTATLIRTKQIVRRIGQSLEKLLGKIFSLYQKYAEPGRLFYVLDSDGKAELKRLSGDWLRGKKDLRLQSFLHHLSPREESSNNTNMLSLLLSPPLFQLGIAGPDTVYEATKKVMKSLEYRGVPLHKPDVAPDSPPPDEEHRAMARGDKVLPHRGEDFEKHLQEHQMMLSEPNVREMMGLDGVQSLVEHVQSTVEMYQQVQEERRKMAEIAQQMQNEMAKRGVRPGMAGDSSVEEGAASGANVQGGMANAQ